MVLNGCSQPHRLAGMRLNAILHVQKTRRALQYADVFLAETKGGESLTQLRGRKRLHRQMMLRGGGADTGDHGAVGTTNRQAWTFAEQMNALALFEIVPALEGAADQGDVIGMFVVGFADDARVAVRAAAIVAESELLQSEDAPAAPRQLAGRRRSHAADAHHDCVKDTLRHC